MPYKHIALVGLGLIASSISLSLRRCNNSIKITGTSRSAETRAKAIDLKICEVCENVIDAVNGADLVILCVPVGAMTSVAKEIAPFLKPGVTLTDVGSVKVDVIKNILPILPKHVDFIPAHPLAGTENSGPESGFSTLFDNRWCLLTPLKGTSEESIDRLRSLWETLGAKVDTMTPEHHDLVLAVTSHVPHLIAYTMVGVADDLASVTKSEVINYSAAGFRDFTRLAASDPTMWRDVFLNNKEASLEILGRFTEELFSLQSAVRRGDGDFLFDYFTRTRLVRRSIVDAGQDTNEPNFGRKLN
jgi:cyclohexadieny/prephenate dehydrogenase